MEDYSKYSEKGEVLMIQALKKYKDNDIEGAEKDRKEANRMFDLATMHMDSDLGKLGMLYGESRNFGIIYNVFEQNIDTLCQDKEKQRIIKEAYDLIKSNKLLSEQFKIYDLFENASDVENVKEFVNEATALVGNFDRRQVKENNEKLIKLIRDNKLDEYVEIPEETENLYEAIEYVILNNKSLDNVNDFIKAQNTIAEHIEKNQKELLQENKESLTFDRFKNKVNKEEEKLEESINEEEKKLLEDFTNAKSNKKLVFENYKAQTLSKIKEAIENSKEEDKESWNNIYESVNSKTYSEKMTQNIINCAEMLEICSTLDE